MKVCLCCGLKLIRSHYNLPKLWAVTVWPFFLRHKCSSSSSGSNDSLCALSCDAHNVLDLCVCCYVRIHSAHNVLDLCVCCYVRIHSVILVIISLLFGLFVLAIGCDQVCDSAVACFYSGDIYCQLVSRTCCVH